MRFKSVLFMAGTSERAVGKTALWSARVVGSEKSHITDSKELPGKSALNWSVRELFRLFERRKCEKQLRENTHNFKRKRYSQVRLGVWCQSVDVFLTKWINYNCLVPGHQMNCNFVNLKRQKRKTVQQSKVSNPSNRAVLRAKPNTFERFAASVRIYCQD